MLATDYVLENFDMHKPLFEQHKSIDAMIESNMKYLINFNCKILLDLNANNLDKNINLLEYLQHNKPQSIKFIFNFPHVNKVKMLIHLNRHLLTSFFQSIEKLILKNSLETVCKIYVSLCHGQSGLNEVEPQNKHRTWKNSWQLLEMASNGNFTLKNVLQFSMKSFQSILGSDQSIIYLE